MSFIIYPVVACWVWNGEGWLALHGYHDFAGSSVVHLVGGLSGLVANVFVGQRLGHFKEPVFPCLCKNRRSRSREEKHAKIRQKIEAMEVPELDEILKKHNMGSDIKEGIKLYCLQ